VDSRLPSFLFQVDLQMPLLLPGQLLLLLLQLQLPLLLLLLLLQLPILLLPRLQLSGGGHNLLLQLRVPLLVLLEQGLTLTIHICLPQLQGQRRGICLSLLQLLHVCLSQLPQLGLQQR
jgi:hypothetical protein